MQFSESGFIAQQTTPGLFMSWLGETLQSFLREHGISVGRLSKASAISRNTIYRWLRSGDAVSDSTALLADSLDVIDEGLGAKFLEQLLGRQVGNFSGARPAYKLSFALEKTMMRRDISQADIFRHNPKYSRAHLSQWKTGTHTPMTLQLMGLAEMLDQIEDAAGAEFLSRFFGRKIGILRSRDLSLL